MGSLGEEEVQQTSCWRIVQVRLRLEDQGGHGGGWQTGQSHICMWMNWEEQMGSETDHATQGF